MSEFYQMPLFVKLKVKNIEVSKNWYSKVLNFYSIFDFNDANGNISMVHLRGGKYQDLMLLKSTDFKLMAFSIKENIALKAYETSKNEDIERTIEEAGLEKDILKLPKGIDTHIYKIF